MDCGVNWTCTLVPNFSWLSTALVHVKLFVTSPMNCAFTSMEGPLQSLSSLEALSKFALKIVELNPLTKSATEMTP